jgi:hypothetical protein
MRGRQHGWNMAPLLEVRVRDQMSAVSVSYESGSTASFYHVLTLAFEACSLSMNTP